MRIETQLEKPALEAIDDILYCQFKTEIDNNRAKQMCGNIVRQIMEYHGYELEKMV